MALEETAAPAFEARNATYETQGANDQSFAVTSGEYPEEDEAEHDDDAQNGGDGCVDGQVADGCQGQVDEDAGEPEPEMGEEVHHRIEDDAGGGMLATNVLRQFEDAVWLATKTSYWGGVVQGVSGDGEAVNAPETQAVGLVTTTTADNRLPREGVDAVDDDPNTHDGDEPVARMTDMLPKFDEADVEGEEHHNHGGQAEEEEDIIEALLGHRLSARRRQKAS